jgi:RNA polymerase sigma-70 factor (ECF subfamily)
MMMRSTGPERQLGFPDWGWTGYVVGGCLAGSSLGRAGAGRDDPIRGRRGRSFTAANHHAPDREASGDELDLVRALRAGEEGAFLELVDRYNGSMIRLAQSYVRTRAAAEDVAQDAWLAVVAGVERFEGRSSLRTWLFRIVVLRAQTRGARESRSVPFSSMDGQGEGGADVDPDRFHDESSRYAGHWASPPTPWPDRALMDAETRCFLQAEIERLPAMQRAVVTLRDMEGLEAQEVCQALGLSGANQRVLLHRARCRMRAALERHLEGGRP